MKRCPSCQKTYDDAQGFCSVDATPLVGEANFYDSQKTLLASVPEPAANVASPPHYINAASQRSPNYQQQAPPHQQWGAPVHARGGGNTNTLLLSVIGLLLVAGIGLGVYFMTRSNSSTASTSSGSPTSGPSSAGPASASNKFVGKWKGAQGHNVLKVLTFKADGTWDFQEESRIYRGTYSPGESRATLNVEGIEEKYIVGIEGSQLMTQWLGVDGQTKDTSKEYFTRIE